MAETEPRAEPSERLVLVVDDDEEMRDLVKMTAKMEGFRVAGAADGFEAARIIEQTLPDLIVTDLMMPGQGGFEFLRGLQAVGRAGIPVFVVSGSRLDDSTIAMIRQEANVVAFFAKPLIVTPFMAAMHECLNTEPPGMKTPDAP